MDNQHLRWILQLAAIPDEAAAFAADFAGTAHRREIAGGADRREGVIRQRNQRALWHIFDDCPPFTRRRFNLRVARVTLRHDDRLSLRSCDHFTSGERGGETD